MNRMMVLKIWFFAALSFFLAFFTNSFTLNNKKIVHESSAISEAPSLQDISSISIALQDEVEMKIERRGYRWWQVEPFLHLMESFPVEQLVDTIKDLRRISRAKIDANTARLSPPIAIIKLQVNSRSPIVIQLGRIGIAGRAYLRIKDSLFVDVVDNSLHALILEQDIRSWRARRLFPDLSVNAKLIKREMLGMPILKIQKNFSGWNIEKPFKVHGDELVINESILKLTSLSSKKFIMDQPEDLSLFGLDNPVLKYSFTDENNTDHVLRIGSLADPITNERYGMVDSRPTVFQVAIDSLASLLMPTSYYVAKQPLLVTPLLVKKIVIEPGSISFERSLDTWVKSATKELIEGQKVDRFLACVLNEHSLEIVERPDLPLSKGSVSLFDSKGALLGRFECGNYGQGWGLWTTGDLLWVYAKDSEIEYFSKFNLW